MGRVVTIGTVISFYFIVVPPLQLYNIQLINLKHTIHYLAVDLFPFVFGAYYREDLALTRGESRYDRYSDQFYFIVAPPLQSYHYHQYIAVVSSISDGQLVSNEYYHSSPRFIKLRNQLFLFGSCQIITVLRHPIGDSGGSCCSPPWYWLGKKQRRRLTISYPYNLYRTGFCALSKILVFVPNGFFL